MERKDIRVGDTVIIRERGERQEGKVLELHGGFAVVDGIEPYRGPADFGYPMIEEVS